MKLVARKPFFISGFGDIIPGQAFEISARHGKVLKALGKARDQSQQLDEPEPPRYTRAVPRQIPEEAAPRPEQSHEHSPPAPVTSVSAPAPSSTSQSDPAHILAALRTRAEAMGIKVDGRWAEERLREEIAAAQAQRYQRRDMRPQE